MKINNKQIGIMALWGLFIIFLKVPTSLSELLVAVITASAIVFISLFAIELIEKKYDNNRLQGSGFGFSPVEQMESCCSGCFRWR